MNSFVVLPISLVCTCIFIVYESQRYDVLEYGYVLGLVRVKRVFMSATQDKKSESPVVDAGKEAKIADASVESGLSKKAKAVIAGLVAVVLIAGVCTGVHVYMRNKAHERAVKDCQNITATYKTDTVKYGKKLASLKDVLGIQENQVEDSQTVKALAKDASYKTVTLKACSVNLDTKTLQGISATNRKSADALEAVLKVIDKDAKAVAKSKTAKDVQDATNNLKAKLDEANNKLGESNGKVADENTRTTLQNAINDAQKLYDDKSQNVDDLNNKAKALEDAVNAVNGSEQAKAQADAQAAAAAAAQAAQSKRSNRGYSAPKSNSGSGSSEPKSDSGSGALGPVWEGMTGEEWNRLYGPPCQGEACNTVL